MHDATGESGLSRYFEQTPWPIALLMGPDHRFSEANPTYRKMFLGNRSDFRGKTVSQLLPEAGAQGFLALLDSVYQTGTPFEGKEAYFEIIDSNGKPKDFYLNFSYSPYRNEADKIIGVLASIFDVTDEVKSRHQFERAVEVSYLEQQKLEAVISNAPIGIAVLIGTDLRFERVNQKFEELVSPRDYIGLRWEDVYNETKDEILPNLLREVFKTGQPYNGLELTTRVERIAGQLESRICDYNFVPLHSPSGVVASLLVQCKDVTDRVANRRVGEENERDLVDTLESMSDAFFALDKDWIITRVNDHHVRATVYPREKQIGSNLLDLFFSDPIYKDSIYLHS
ncbi:MAG: PAS domain-containing protein, partial [Proteobacteria bacterium]